MSNELNFTIKKIKKENWDGFTSWCKLCDISPNQFFLNTIEMFKMNENELQNAKMINFYNFVTNKENQEEIDKTLEELDVKYGYLSNDVKDTFRYIFAVKKSKEIIEKYDL